MSEAGEASGGEAPGAPPAKIARVDDNGLRAAYERLQRELVEAQRRVQDAQDATRRAQDAERRAQDAERRAQRNERLTVLSNISARDLPDIIAPTGGGGSRSSTTTVELVEDILVEHAGDAAVAALLPPARDPAAEERVCRELESLLRQLAPLPSPAAANEVAFWQRYIAVVLEGLRRIAQRDGLAMLKVHHDEPSSTSRKHRPDFSFTLPNEHHVHYSTTCFVMEAKPSTRRAQSRAALFREAAAQCITHLAYRQRACDHLPQTGYALATAGEGLCIVRVDFSPSTARVHLSRELPFLPSAAFREPATGENPRAAWDAFFAAPLVLPAAWGGGGGSCAASAGGVASVTGGGGAATGGDGSGAPAAALPILPGLRALVRLALTHDLSAFGLGRITAMPPPGGPYTAGELLGEGGYANVAVWRNAATGEAVAAKYLRVPRDGDGRAAPVEREADILAALEAAGVPRVPRLVLPAGVAGASRTVTAADGRQVLLLRPIGEPLRRHVGGLPDAERAAAAAAMGEQLWGTLTRAHAAGLLHGDVRPGNMVRVAGAPGGGGAAAPVEWGTPEPSWMLIDWGLGETLAAAARRPSTKMRGEMAFQSDRRLRLLASAAAAAAGADAPVWAPAPQDDLDAAVLTFLAVAGSGDCGASWPRGALVAPVHVLEERREWVVERQQAVDAAVALLPPGSALHAAVGAYMAA